MSKTHLKLTINKQQVELTTIKKSGTCWKCQNYKEICLISERKNLSNNWEIRKFCWSCSLSNLYQLEESDYELANKREIVKELRNELHNHE